MMQINDSKVVFNQTFLKICMGVLVFLAQNSLSRMTEINAEDTVTDQTQQATQETPIKQVSANDSGEKKAYQFVYKFQPNQIIRYSIKNTSSVDTTKGEFSENNSNESLTEMHYRVVSLDSENQAVLEPVLDHVKMSATFGEADPVSYDSAKDTESPAQFTGVDKSIGKPLSRYKFNQQGKLLEILDLRNAGKGDPNLTNASNNSIELLGSKNFLIFFPDHPLSIGDKWTEKYESELLVNETLTQRLKFIRKYQLESVENNQAVISLKTVLITLVDDPKQRLQLIQKAPTGTLVFDILKGNVVSRELIIKQTEFGIFGQNSKISVKVSRTEKQVQ